jgi:hypothetical protein
VSANNDEAEDMNEYKLTIARLQKELYAAHSYRAAMYMNTYKELKKEFGRTKGKEVFERIMDVQAQYLSKRFPLPEVKSIDELKTILLEGTKRHSSELVMASDNVIEIKLPRCELKDTFKESDMSIEESAWLCRLAERVVEFRCKDRGFSYTSEIWAERDDENCFYKFKADDQKCSLNKK